MIIRTIKLKKILLYLAATFAFGVIGALLGGGTGQIYTSLNKPPLSPPGIVFPIVWSILYLLMGIGAYFLSNEKNPKSSFLLKIYWVQLILNALWPLIFWRLRAYEFAAVIIVALIILVVILTIGSFKINKFSFFYLTVFIKYIFVPFCAVGAE